MDQVFFIITAALLVGPNAAKTVYSTSGVVQGMKKFNVYNFLGIPFAEPPTGEGRFAKPVWKTRMPGIYNATFFRPKCPQPLEDNASVNINDTFDEDCLYLNIHSPIMASRASPKSVMVWVHGGSFFQGSGEDYPGTILALHHDVVVVTINYRLGALGFLSTGDNHAVGNYGLWDQTMALEWIRVNIAEFGGDPYSVTIFGESAGSASVTQLALSPFTKGLFQRVIAESGTASAEWSNLREPLKPARKLARLLHCPNESKKELIHCLRQRSVKDVLHSQQFMQTDNGFIPTYGTEFLPYSPQELMTSQINSPVAKRLAKLDFIIGQNSDEGAMFFRSSLSQILDPGDVINKTTGITQKIFDSALVQAALLIAPGNLVLAEKLVAPLKFMYRNWKENRDGVGLSRDYIRLVSDIFFTVSIVDFARTHTLLRNHWNISTNTSGTFMYLFDHRGSWLSKEPWRVGADHVDEVYFVFGYPHMGKVLPSVTEDEKQLSTTVMKYWTDFAKTGNPNSAQPGPGHVTWPRYEINTEKYLKLSTDMTETSVGQRVFNERVEFWSKFIPAQMRIYHQEPVPGLCKTV